MKEKVSALLDGALDDVASTRLLDSLKRDGALRQDWESYCLIGDVLRDEGVLSADFTRNVMTAIQDEPVIVAPIRKAGSEGMARHFMPIAASVMGVVAVGVVAMSLNSGGAGADKLAATKAAPVALASGSAVSAARPASVAAEPSDKEYLFAHQAMSPSAAMPGVALYVRTVSDTRQTAQR